VLAVALFVVERERGMGIGASGAHFRGNPHCLHQFLLRGAMPQHIVLNAITMAQSEL
jgi:hypothetical protein